MQGISRSSNAFGAGDLANLRKSVMWSSPQHPTLRRGALQERLEELLVLELHKDGGRTFLNFTVRGLYKHVLAAISSKISGKRERDELNFMVQKKGGQRKGTMGEQMSSPVVLGALSAHIETSESEDHTDSGGRNDESNPKVDSTSGILDDSAPPELPVRNRDLKPVSSYTHRVVERAEGADHSTSYRDRLGGYLHPRDMRRLVTPFSASNEPGLIVRRHVMLFNFDPMRAVILKDRLLVIVPDGADSILAQLEKRVRGGTMEMERDFLGHDSAESDIGLSEHSKPGRKRGKKFRFGSKHRSNVVSLESRSANNSDDGISDTETEPTQVIDEYTNAQQTADDEWNDLQGTEWIDLPFELQAADAVLHTISSFLSGDTIELHQAATAYIERIVDDRTRAREDPLTIIRAVKEGIREMSGRVKGFVQSITRILDEDEDMALMNLTRLQTHPERFMYPVSAEVLEEESDEPELILESYLQEGLSLVNVLDSIQGQIDTAAELVDQRLDSVRNRILMANMVLTAFSVAVAIASVIGSFFGMNVPVPYDEDDRAFRKIVFGTLAGVLSLFTMTMFVLFYTGTIPQFGVAN